MHKITELYAFVAIDSDGDEGLIAFLDKTSGHWMPMIGSDMARLESLRPVAADIMQGKPYNILHFKLTGELPRLVFGCTTANGKRRSSNETQVEQTGEAGT